MTKVIGHDAVFAAFDGAWQKGRVGHAYLFVGPSGVGKHSLATQLARDLLCQTPRQSLGGCGTCQDCVLCASGAHPDLLRAERPEDKVDFPIEAIRDLIEQFSLKAFRGGRKVAIVDHAVDFNDASANAFLKTLEEPPPRSVLILIGGTSADLMLPTILSRCQTIVFKPLPPGIVRDLLSQRGHTDARMVDRLVRMCGGSIGLAESLADDSFWEFRARLLKALVADKFNPIELATDWSDQLEQAGKASGQRRRRAALIFRIMIGMFQDAQRIAASVPPIAADSSETETLRALAAKLGPDRLIEIIDRILDADRQNERAVSLDLIVEALVDFLAR